MYKKLSLLLIISLLIGNIYLYTKIQKLDYDIVIGVPVVGENGDIANNFLNSKPISNKDDFNSLIFSLIDATSINKPIICENLPNSIITINDRENAIQYYDAYVWIDGTSLIIGTIEENPIYKIIDTNNSQKILKIIEKYTAK